MEYSFVFCEEYGQTHRTELSTSIPQTDLKYDDEMYEIGGYHVIVNGNQLLLTYAKEDELDEVVQMSFGK